MVINMKLLWFFSVINSASLQRENGLSLYGKKYFGQISIWMGELGKEDAVSN